MRTAPSSSQIQSLEPESPMGDMWGMCIYESVQGAVTSTAQVKGLLAPRSREESKQRGSSQFKVTCHQQRGSWVLGARMERDSQAHPHPQQSESARELNPGNKEQQREARAQRAQPPPQAYTGLCPSSAIPRKFGWSKVRRGRSGILVGFIRRLPWDGLEQS